MRYVLRQKVFSIGGDFTITDAQGREVFFVDGKAISLGRRLLFKDMRGEELAVIQEQLISLTPTFEIRRAGGPSARIARKLISPIVDRLKIDLPGWDDIEVRGDLFDHEYSFTRGGREIARVSKSWFSFRDAYGVDIAEGEDDVLILAGAVVIDEMLDDRQRSS